MEGYPGLVVHGPLPALLMLELVRRNAPERQRPHLLGAHLGVTPDDRIMERPTRAEIASLLRMPDDITHAPRDDVPDESRRERLSRTFDEDAELYDRARPGYPPELYDDLAELAGATRGSRVLEVGCGTGQATVPLAERGCRITAVEAGPSMAAVARRNLAGTAGVEVVTAEFESWPLPREPFDVVVSATAFHWIDPAVRMVKAADALRPGGALAVVRTQHVRGGTEEFFIEVQGCYERFDPNTPPGLRPPAATDIDGSDHAEEVARSGRFGPTVFRRHERELTYTTAQYLDVLRTYSGHRALPETARNGLLDCIAALIDRRYGGLVTKRHLFELAVSHRRSGPGRVPPRDPTVETCPGGLTSTGP